MKYVYQFFIKFLSPTEEGGKSTLLFVLYQFILFNQSLGYIVQCGIYVLTTLVGTVHLSNLNILVDAHANWNTWKGNNLSQGQLQDNTIHQGHTLDIPLTSGRCNQIIIIILIGNSLLQ